MTNVGKLINVWKHFMYY